MAGLTGRHGRLRRPGPAGVSRSGPTIFARLADDCIDLLHGLLLEIDGFGNPGAALARPFLLDPPHAPTRPRKRFHGPETGYSIAAD